MDHRVSRLSETRVEFRPGVRKSGRGTVIAQIAVQTPHNILRAEAEDADARLAIDGAAVRLASQRRRYHERRTARKADRDLVATDPTTDAVLAAIGALPLPADDPDRDGVCQVVRIKRFGTKPIDIDEAIDQMEFLGHAFFLFDTTEDGTISLGYRRRAGVYGVLVPEHG